MNNKKWVLDNTINAKNVMVWKILKEVCPSYARHMFDENRVVEAFYMSDKGGINPLDMPICKVDGCNRPGVHINDPAFKDPPKYDQETGELIERLNCYCDKHGATYNTKNLRSFLIEDLKIDPKVIMQMELILYGYGGIYNDFIGLQKTMC